MHIKRFEARDMPAALKLIKQEFGMNAVILSAKSLQRDKGLRAFFRKPGVEVTAAVDSPRSSESEEASALLQEKHDAGDIGSTVYTRAGFLDGQKTGPVFSAMPQRASLNERHTGQADTRHLFNLYGEMTAKDVSAELSSELVKKIHWRITPEELENEASIRDCLAGIIEEMSIAGGAIPISSRRRKVVAFVGPTGVGKTTTVAKLAAHYAFRCRKKVALVTTDTARIGAVEQIRIYSRIMKVPLCVATDIEELQNRLGQPDDADLILIDTAGISQNNKAGLQQLKACLDSVRPLEVHLVISATTKEKDVGDILDKFGIMPINRMVITKVDEATTCGPIMNQVASAKVPVSFIGRGQNIVDDLVPATPAVLVDWIMGNATEQDRGLLRDSEEEVKPRLRAVEVPYPNKFYIANKNSDVFHYHSCKWAKKIKAKNMIVFDNMDEALSLELKPCRLCIPEEAQREDGLTKIRLRASV